MFSSNIIPIEDVMVRPEVVETHFSCDLEKCKGACCTLESEYGAPLREEEIRKIEEILDIVLPYLPEEHQKEIEDNGFYDVKDGWPLASITGLAFLFTSTAISQNAELRKLSSTEK